MTDRMIELGRTTLERADRLTSEIKALELSMTKPLNKIKWVDWNTEEPYLPQDLLQRVMDVGRARLLEDLGRELNDLSFPMSDEGKSVISGGEGRNYPI